MPATVNDASAMRNQYRPASMQPQVYPRVDQMRGTPLRPLKRKKKAKLEPIETKVPTAPAENEDDIFEREETHRGQPAPAQRADEAQAPLPRVKRITAA